MGTGKILKEIRTNSGYSLHEMANVFGVTHALICTIESGGSEIHPAWIRKLKEMAKESETEFDIEKILDAYEESYAKKRKERKERVRERNKQKVKDRRLKNE